MFGSNAPELVRDFKDPETDRPYLLYRPSGYDRNKEWPLVVVCSSTFPDSPAKQINSWSLLAESSGFLVLAPTLKATTGLMAPKPEKFLPLQREDERHLLAAVQHVRAGHSVSEDRVFFFASGSGACSALYTALKHPEIVRAVAVSEPHFHEGCVGTSTGRVDPYQPVQVYFRRSDVLSGKQGKACEEWLRSHGADLREHRPGSSSPGDPQDAVGFFKEVLRSSVWMKVRVQTLDPGKPREFKFKLDSSFTPTKYQWEFGDGGTSPIAEPTHAYAASGNYRVTVTATADKRSSHTRTREVVVP